VLVVRTFTVDSAVRVRIGESGSSTPTRTKALALTIRRHRVTSKTVLIALISTPPHEAVPVERLRARFER
jgi:hypothetical protein